MNWCIEEKGYSKEKIEFLGSKLSIGNGYMGYRGTLQEYGPDQLVACTISEIFDDNGNGWREPINMPNGLYTVTEYKGQKMSVIDRDVLDHTHSLYIDSGRQYRRSSFLTDDNKVITIEAEQFVSIDNEHIMTMRYAVEASDDIEVDVTTTIDDNIWNINGNHFSDVGFFQEDDMSGLCCITLQDKRQIAICQSVKIICGKAVLSKEGNSVLFKASIKKGETFTFEKYVAIAKDTDCDSVKKCALDYCRVAYSSGYDKLLERQTECWAKRYREIGISIKGDEEAEKAIYYSCYLLYSSAPGHTDTVAIPARGLSGQVYKGAYFWDTEIYMLPMFAYCNPKIAKNLMMYRVHNLSGAYEKAEEYEYRGAFFPWESQENGRDGCTHYNLTDVFTGRKMRTYFRDKQIHISADVAYGIWKYVNITKDYSILLEGGAEVILECARFFNSYAYFKKDKDRFEFLDVTGADEYHERVNNDAYTNYMIWLNAKIAIETIEWLHKNHMDIYDSIMNKLDYQKEYEEVRELFEKIYLPKPNEDGVIEQFSGYFKEEDISIDELYSRIIKPNEYLGSPVGLAVNTQILKQADVVLMLSLLSEDFSDEIKQKNWEYYEPRTEHGSSLSTCIYALLAAKIGKTEWAYKYLMKAATLDLSGEYKQYLGSLYIGGTHPAANGGTWIVTVQGFGGLEAADDGVVLNPHLPDCWQSLGFVFNYGEYNCMANIDKNTITIDVTSGCQEKLKIKVRGKEYFCEPGSSIKILY